MSQAQTILDRIDAGIQSDVNLLVARVHRFDAEPKKGLPHRYGWHLLLPQEGGYPFHMSVLGLVDSQTDAHLLPALTIKRGLHMLAWLDLIPLRNEVRETTLLDFMIDQVAPLEFQRAMHDGDPEYLKRLTVLATAKGERGKWALQV